MINVLGWEWNIFISSKSVLVGEGRRVRLPNKLFLPSYNVNSFSDCSGVDRKLYMHKWQLEGYWTFQSYMMLDLKHKWETS